MKKLFTISIILFVCNFANAQHHLPDSILSSFKNASNDSLRYKANIQAYFYFEELNVDSAIYYANQTLFLARKNNKNLVIARALANKGYQLTHKGKYAEALNNLLGAFALAGDKKNASNSWFSTQQSSAEKNRLLMLSLIHHMYALLMTATQNSEQEIFHFKEAKRIALEINNVPRIMLADMNLGAVYLLQNNIDSASFFLTEAKYLTLKFGPEKYLGYIYANLGDIALKKHEKTIAKQIYNQGLNFAIQQNNQSSADRIYLRLADFYLAESQKDSSLYFAKKMLETSKTLGLTGPTLNLGIAYQHLYLSYDLRKQPDSALKYAGLALVTTNVINKERIANLAQFQSSLLKEQLRLQGLEKEKVRYQSLVRTYSLLAGLGVFLIVALILYRNNLQKHKANMVLAQTLTNLKTTQTQLIQSEKMASLGELTAGIAHEIQNPLNFVNNFSEVNQEMLDELDEELNKGDINEVKAIAAGIRQNEEKINHHGKRADAIVKGMLQHSQTGKGTKEPTDINSLAEGSMQLAYHAMQSKHPDFGAEIFTHFDAALIKVSVIPQDIGRVLLNLFNNALYAVNQKQKATGTEYRPEVSVTTASENGSIIITVKDNGNGIPDAIKDKIMQPFFTTKPTGEGTGLGLSLSYDIVVKGHGGSINVETKEGAFTEFTIILPIN